MTDQEKAIVTIIQHGIDRMDDLDQDIEASELHHYLYNEDYFIIGTYQAKQFLAGYGVFDAIEKIKQYEQEQFGEVTTDFSDPEKVVNMLAYIIGEEALSACPRLGNVWDIRLSDDDMETIKSQLEAQVK